MRVGVTIFFAFLGYIFFVYRKKRTSIDTSIRVALEKGFLSNPKPTSEEISLIADGLNMEKEVRSMTGDTSAERQDSRELETNSEE